MKQGNIPLRDTYDQWILEQLSRAYFEGAIQVISNVYVGTAITTDTLSQRFRRMSQRTWDPHARRAIYATAKEYGNQIMTLVRETDHLTPAEILQQVPELDRVFFDGLSDRLQQK